MKKGDVIFTIDPEQFQFDVKRLEAALAAAEQSVPQLKSSLDQATAAVEKANVQLKLANEEFERQTELFEKKVVAQATLDRAERNLQSACKGSPARKRRKSARDWLTSPISASRTPQSRKCGSNWRRPSTMSSNRPCAHPATATRPISSWCPALS